MSTLSQRILTRVLAGCMVFSSCAPLPSVAADDVLASVRARGMLRCAGIVRPGIAVPTADGKRWYGIAPDVCRAIAGAVLGAPERMTFFPYFGGELASGARDEAADVVFLSGAQLVGNAAAEAAPFQLGPVVAHDSLALLVPASGVAHAVDLAAKRVCAEAGSPAERALTRYFAQHAIALREHPFQETDEMRQAYGTGNCDALAGPLTVLASVRADPQDGNPADRILPELLADDPIFAATSGDARWSRIVWWTFSVLVDAEDSSIVAGAEGGGAAIPGVPPAVGTELGLPSTWTHDALAGGNYGELFDRDLGRASRFHLARGANALSRDGGLIFGLHVE